MLVILGSINADLLFKVESLPAPGETVLCPSYTMDPGGKGANQAAAAAKAGAEVVFLGHLGSDAYAPVVRARMVEAGVECTHLRTSEAPTAIAVIGVDAQGENAIIVASGANLTTHAGQLDDVTLAPGTLLLCQNEIRPEETHAALQHAKAKGAITVLNLAPASEVPPEILDALDYLIVNEIEAASAARTAPNATTPEALARHLAQRHNLTCVVTLGGQGALAITPDGAGHRVHAMSGIAPVDTTGAGDAFVGVLAASLDAGHALPQALRYAACGAGLTCLHLGCQIAQPKLADIEGHLSLVPDAESLAAPA